MDYTTKKTHNKKKKQEELTLAKHGIKRIVTGPQHKCVCGKDIQQKNSKLRIQCDVSPGLEPKKKLHFTCLDAFNAHKIIFTVVTSI